MTRPDENDIFASVGIGLCFLIFGVVVGGIIWAAIAESYSPPHYAAVCTASHTDYVFMPVFNTSTKMVEMQMQPQWTCDRYETQCVQGSNYQGPKKTCNEED